MQTSPASTIFHEMMSHPALFTHPHPMKVVIIGDEDQFILQEVIKHDHLSEIILMGNKAVTNTNTNPKVHVDTADVGDWIKKGVPHSVDIIIHAAAHPDLLGAFFNVLTADGILIQAGQSPLDVAGIKQLAKQLQSAGFKDHQILHFPQPDFSSGWRYAIMATKRTHFKRAREQAIYGKSFKTYYYNLDTHKASLVLPEFMREEWVS